MTVLQTESVGELEAVSSEEGRLLAQAVISGFEPGKAPLKVVTGTQTSSSLSFELKPGAIVAHPNSTVIFVCG
ncbi:hypothetical protein B7R78_0009385 [Ralstonia solanacearum]|uniref:Uncharacterized protein n=1 Tax=Ralstonia solanacearum K60 TaxID=1091042 RepID=A0AAP7ZLH6_RALSL|nr:hypothetical protein [Ralstonia solanacearum]MBT1537337.1 hypothetical protein [Ralstonia solanacearum]OYQ12708.1 hypothetical protein B7R77_05210 [Ralstonia solanacearum K60]QOK83046.1 hypothetical protein HF906_13335 [Ralstonia solanacearum]RIJ87635.1 hypothetical protein RSP822_04610 [Ralstonia solanacearum]CCF96987.1 hypothetical protein RSK60_1740010 [Ralstonia solanacearum K60]